MKYWLIILLFSCTDIFINCQEDSITFGGASEEEEEIMKPKIEFNIKESSIVKSEMQFLYILCSVDKIKPDKYTSRWIKQSGELVSPNKVLFLKSLLKLQEGRYLCEIEIKKKKFNKTLDLSVTIPSISIQILSDESLRIGGNIKRKCSDLGLERKSVVDTFTYTWFDQMNKTVSTTDVLDIPIRDASIGGPYECHYTSISSGRVYTAKTLVNIQEERRSAINYKIQITTNPNVLKFAEPFSLRCDVTPIADFKYQWFKEDVQIGAEQTISFPSFKKEHVGIYKCKATASFRSGDISLEAESAQQFPFFQQTKIELSEKPGPFIFVHSGERKELHCEIETDSGNRGVNVEWYINGKLLKNGNVPNVHRLDKELVSLLVIQDIVPANEGNYECRVGSKRKEVNIVVMSEPGVIETSPPLLRVKEGQSVEFHCRVENIPGVKNVQLKWRFESKDGSLKYPIPDNRWSQSNPEIAEQTSFVELMRAELRDSGYLICSEPNGKTAKSELVVIPSEASVITITPKEIRVRPGQRFDIECFTKNTQGRASGQPKFFFSNEKAVGRDSRFVVTNVGPSHVRLTAPNGLPLSEDKMDVFCGSAQQRVSSKIFIKDLCPPGHRYCQNGQCIENAKFCDGKNDCEDKSDENPIFCKSCDPISKKCEVHKGAIPTKNYYLVHWACDGEEDCGNGYDEENCGDGFLENCGGKYFTCSDGKKIPRGYLCDQNNDCANAEDETGCTAPQIVNTTSTDMKATKGQRVTMTCEASGKPLPSIVWRFNWGCVQQYPRFVIRSTSNNCLSIISTLTIDNFQPGDDGIYNCEALSSRQRAFSNDFQVVLQNKDL